MPLSSDESPGASTCIERLGGKYGRCRAITPQNIAAGVLVFRIGCCDLAVVQRTNDKERYDLVTALVMAGSTRPPIPDSIP